MKLSIGLAAVSVIVTATILLGPIAVVQADERDEAERLCMDKIRDVYKVDKFRQVSADKDGHHKFRIYGNVKYHQHKYPFDCKVKRGYVKSYHYDGPHPGSADDDGGDHDKLGKAVAVGAGLALVVSAAAAAASKEDQESTLDVKQTILEDECHDELVHRLRDERHETAEVRLDSASLKGSTLSGQATVDYNHHRPQHATYACHFHSSGHVRDSSYNLY